MSAEESAAASFAAGYETATGWRGAGGDADVSQITPGTSWWHHRECRTCGHTFRRGDRVRVSGHRVWHLDPALGCAEAGDLRPRSAVEAEFSDHLLAAWPPGGGVTVTRLDPGDPLLAPPRGG